MAIPKPHVRLNTDRQTEGQFQFRYATRFPQINEEEELPAVKDYTRVARQFSSSLIRLRRDRIVRIESRNPALSIPLHIDYIRLQFQSQFDSTTYFAKYLEDFGLEAITFSKFGTEGLFAVVDEVKVRNFIRSLEIFIRSILEKEQNAVYDGKIKYIRNFELLTTESIIQSIESIGSLTFRLADFPFNSQFYQEIWPSFEKYLKEHNLQYNYLSGNYSLEVDGLTKESLTEIANNFDIILSATSNLSTVVEPSRVSIPKRSYGFTISQSHDTLPVIGIIDTGISSLTPLRSILLDDTFDLTGTGSNVDNANHGTGVAALAAMGKRPYALNYRGEINSDARLLSIKVMDASSSNLKPSDVIKLLNEVNRKYPEVKTFVLTIASEMHKRNDEDHSIYAAELDRFSYENDCLIFISTANNNKAADDNTGYNLGYFGNEVTNLCSPAESMNNITIGAASDNITGNIGWAISDGSEYPALYTRKHHCNLKNFYPRNKNNKHYFKPDVIESGGDYEYYKFFIAQGSRASLEVLSSDPAESFYRQIGTSYSAPLAANLAAKMQALYPELKSQTLKALIINSADHKMISFPTEHKHLLNSVTGNGFVNGEKTLYSDENTISFIIEDEVMPGIMQLYPIRLPEYLYDGTIAKKAGILKITATLCFSFLPYLSNHLCYCPVHIGFSIFRNKDSNSIMNHYDEAKLREAWTQDAFHKAKPIPYSNSQKISFTVGRNELVSEDGTFKLAVNCKLNPQLSGHEMTYQHNHKFSMVIRIEENLTEAKLTGRLYNELIAINEIENIATADIELEGTL